LSKAGGLAALRGMDSLVEILIPALTVLLFKPGIHALPRGF
jgi:hypothetical protein